MPFNPGGGSDLFARLIAPGLAQSLKRPVLVENRAGAGGVIGTDVVAKSPPDGATLLVSDFGAYAISPALYPKIPYAAADLQPVVEIARFPNVLVVGPKSPLKNLQDLLAAAKRKPGTLTIASAGLGSSPHLTAEKFQQIAQIKLLHIPYKGAAPAIADAMGDQVDIMFTGLPSVAEQVTAGKLRVLAIASASRSPFAPDIPTFAEQGLPNFEAFISQGLFVPAGTPLALVNQINASVVRVMGSKEMQPRLTQLGVEPAKGTAAHYKAWLDKEAQFWSKLIRDASIKPE